MQNKLFINTLTGKWTMLFEANPLVVSEKISFDVPATEWQILHTHDTDNVMIQVYENDKEIIPNSLEIINNSEILISFSQPTSGFALINYIKGF